MEAPELGARLVRDTKFVYLAKDVAPDVYREVMALGIGGVWGERTTERVYPSGTTAGSLLGFVGTDGKGLAGLEQTYNSVLSGTPGKETYEQGAKGQRIPGGTDEVDPAVPGRDVQLTIDRDLQYIAQAALDKQVKKMGAEWGTVEVVDTRSGEILALADSGSIDPNSPANADPSRAAAKVYEPGSTAKVITMAAILENKIATPTSKFTVPYSYTVPNGEVFHDSHEHPTLKLTLTGILAESSNAGTVMVGQNLPLRPAWTTWPSSASVDSTDSGLPGESAGMLRTLKDWNGDGRSPYTILFGQAVSVTTLQATQVFATLANHGVRVQPHLVKAVEDADGTMQPVELDAPNRVVSAETADAVVRMMESAVADGTGTQGRGPRLPDRRQDRYLAGLRGHPDQDRGLVHRHRPGGRPADRGQRDPVPPAGLDLRRHGRGAGVQRGHRVRAAVSRHPAERHEGRPVPDHLEVTAGRGRGATTGPGRHSR